MMEMMEITFSFSFKINNGDFIGDYTLLAFQ